MDSRWGDGSQQVWGEGGGEGRGEGSFKQPTNQLTHQPPQDSQEFLHSLLESLQSETNRVRGKAAYKELDGKGERKRIAQWTEHR